MDLSAEEIGRALAAALARPEWQQSPRLSRFLRFVVEQTLAGAGRIAERNGGRRGSVRPAAGVRSEDRPGGPRRGSTAAAEAAGVLRRTRCGRSRAHRAAEGDVPAALRTRRDSGRSAAAAQTLAVGDRCGGRGGSDWGVARGAVEAGGAGLGCDAAAAHRKSGYNRAPAFSPDGRWTAFSRDISVRRANLYLMPLPEGEARAFTDRGHVRLRAGMVARRAVDCVPPAGGPEPLRHHSAGRWRGTRNGGWRTWRCAARSIGRRMGSRWWRRIATMRRRRTRCSASIRRMGASSSSRRRRRARPAIACLG